MIGTTSIGEPVGVAYWWWECGIAQVEAASNQHSVSCKYENRERDWGDE